MTKSLVAQLSTHTISIAQQKPNATKQVVNITAKVDKVFSDAAKLPEDSHHGIPKEKLDNHTSNATKDNSTSVGAKTNSTKPVSVT